LLEAGHAELAEHFEKEQWQPKGCWVEETVLTAADGTLLRDGRGENSFLAGELGLG
jgi:hypothetical protein